MDIFQDKLKLHERSHSMDFKCDICSTSFLNQNLLKHHKSRQKKCRKRAASTTSTNSTISGNKQFTCQCGFQTNFRNGFKRHKIHFCKRNASGL